MTVNERLPPPPSSRQQTTQHMFREKLGPQQYRKPFHKARSNDRTEHKLEAFPNKHTFVCSMMKQKRQAHHTTFS